MGRTLRNRVRPRLQFGSLVGRNPVIDGHREPDIVAEDVVAAFFGILGIVLACLLYTSDAADEL